MVIEHFVLHYTPLEDRKAHIKNQFGCHNIKDYTFVEEYDRENLTEEQLIKFKIITPSEISLFYKHIDVFRRQYAKGFSGITCVYEDDAVLCDNFLECLDKCIKQLPEDWDMVFGGECADLHEYYRNSEQLVYENNSSRGGAFYMINNRFLNKVVEYFDKTEEIYCPIDWWFNFVFKSVNHNKYKIFWTEPTLVKQGSELGWFKKSINITDARSFKKD